MIIVAERPTRAKGFSGAAKSLLYPLLEETGNANAHLTDVVKTRGKIGEPYPEDIGEHRRFFDREIEIVQPRLIVAFGKKVHNLLQFYLAGHGIRIRQVWHYSYATRWPGKRAEFKKQVQEAVRDRSTAPA